MRNAYVLPLIFIVMAVSFSVLTYAESTQQYNKIFLSPFYVNSLGAGQSVNFTVAVNPPDRVGSIVSAIVAFNAQINGQTQNFTLKVNNKSCIPSSYYIATAFSTTGNIQFSFDCTNAITAAGTHSINLKSEVATGSVSGWLELTYMNSPKGNLDIFGTEYNSFDMATMFLQLLDASTVPINSATCSLIIYYPDKSIWKNNVTMTHLPNSDGLYYYDTALSSITGVYMASATCSLPVNSYTDNFDDFSKIFRYNNVTVSGGVLKLNDSVPAFCAGSASACSTFSSNATCGGQSGCTWNVTNPNWLGGTFNNCSNITLKNSGGSSFNNFAYYINVSKKPEMMANYTDLRFYAGGCGEGGSVLNYEIENYTSSSAKVWVQIPTLFTPTTTISMYYSNISAVGSGQNATGVWNSLYLAVWHLGEATNTTVRDSTSYNNNGTTSGALITSTSGAIGNALSFSALSRLLINSSALDLSTTTSFTLSAWVKPEASIYATTTYPTVYSYGLYRESMGLSSATAGNNGRIEEWVNDVTRHTGTAFIDSNVYSLITITRNSTNTYFYINGRLDSTFTSTAPTGSGALSSIGNSVRVPMTTDEQFYGSVDEMTVAYTIRSSEFVNQTYQMVANQSTYVTFTPVTSVAFCLGTATVCSVFTNYTSCQSQKTCSFTNATNFLSGNVKSIPLSLSVNESWYTFLSSYDVHAGQMAFSILNSTNGTLCTSLGNISLCAGNATPIYLFASLNRTTNISLSPELDQWTVVTRGNTTITELKGSGEIHVSSLNAQFYTLTTNCGDSSPMCATTDNGGGLEGGQAHDIITVTSLTSSDLINISINWTYNTPSGVDCTAFSSLELYNGTVWNDVSANVTLIPDIEHDYCTLKVPLQLIHEGVSQYRVSYSNYVFWEIQWAKTLADAINSTYSPYCDQLAIDNEFYYYVPIDNETAMPDDVNLAYCYRFADDLYWFYYYQSQATEGMTIGEQSILLSEIKFYRNKFYNDVDYFNGLKLIALPANIWNYPNRTLTQDVSVNLSETLGYLREINSTTTNTYSFMTTVLYPLMLSMHTTIGEIFNLSAEINQTLHALTFSPVINTTSILIQNVSYYPVFNISTNATANINVTQFINDLLNADIVEFPITSGSTSYGTGIAKQAGYTITPYSLFYYMNTEHPQVYTGV